LEQRQSNNKTKQNPPKEAGLLPSLWCFIGCFALGFCALAAFALVAWMTGWPRFPEAKASDPQGGLLPPSIHIIQNIHYMFS